MHGDPIETAELLAFARTAEARSVSRAAANLRVPRATISRRLARLEARLRVRLIKRTTRQLSLTDAGERLYVHARAVLDAVERAASCVRSEDAAPRGDLKVSVPPIAAEAFRDFVVGFAEDNPGVRVFLHASTQYVDLVGSGYDVALRAATRLDPGLVARLFARSELVAVASPAYLEAHGTPRSLADLRRHRCLVMFSRGEVPDTHWPLRSGKRLRVDGAFFSNDTELLAHAAKRGLGIAVVPALLVAEEMASGALVPVLPKQLGGESRLSIVYAERELLPPQVRAFVDALGKLDPRELVPAGVARRLLKGAGVTSRGSAPPTRAAGRDRRART